MISRSTDRPLQLFCTQGTSGLTSPCRTLSLLEVNLLVIFHLNNIDLKWLGLIQTRALN